MQQLTKFKKTELGEIPEDWEIKKVGELLNEKTILQIQDGNHGELHPKLADFIPKGIPFLTANCVVNNRISFDNCKYLSESWLKKLRIGFASANDVILTHKGTLGLCAIVPSDIKDIILSPQTTYYRLSDRISYVFLFYFFQSSFFQNELFQMGRQSTRDYVGITSQKSLTVILPPIKEQKRIASILSKVDNLLQKRAQIIHQSQSLKKGLMQRLLTKGIGHTKFKTTEVGEIPETWDLIHLYELVKINPESIDSNYSQADIEYIDIGSVENYQIQKYEHFKLSDRPSRAQRIVRKNDIIVSTVRPYLHGFAKIRDSNQCLICSTGFAVLRCQDVKIVDFIFNYVKSQYFEYQLNKHMTGLAYPAVTSKIVGNTILGYPRNKNEVETIGKILSKVDNLINQQIKEKSLFETLKKGLMQQLMTGKIRVEV